MIYFSLWNDRLLVLILQNATCLMKSTHPCFISPEKPISCCLLSCSIRDSPRCQKCHFPISILKSANTMFENRTKKKRRKWLCQNAPAFLLLLPLISHPDYDSARVPAQITDSLPSPYNRQMREMLCDLLLCLKHTQILTSTIPCGALTQLTMESSIFCDEKPHTLSQTIKIWRLILLIHYDSPSMTWVS